jgi:hypothetical protein
MAGRWELNDEQWAMVEPVVRPARRADNRGCPWHDTRSVLNGGLFVRERHCSGANYPRSILRFRLAIADSRTGSGTENWSRRSDCWPGICMRRANWILVRHSWMLPSRAPTKGGDAVGPTRDCKGPKIAADVTKVAFSVGRCGQGYATYNITCRIGCAMTRPYAKRIDDANKLSLKKIHGSDFH